MERRLYFVAGDLLSNCTMGVASVWLATVIIDPSWHMLVAMPAGMIGGMVLSFVLMPLFVALFGAMEVMLPVMLTAMFAGMTSGMASATHTLSASEILIGGGLSGILVLLLTYAADAGLRGKRP